MSFHVERKVIRPGKRSLAQLTLEWFLTRMFTEMSSQFIRSRKLPGTSFPGACVGLFSSVSSFMCFEMRTFRVHFFTPVEITFMNLSSTKTFRVLIWSRKEGRGDRSIVTNRWTVTGYFIRWGFMECKLSRRTCWWFVVLEAWLTIVYFERVGKTI